MLAETAVEATSTHPRRGQTAWGRAAEAVERLLEAEREQLALWMPVMLGAGIACWLVLPDPRGWAAAGIGFVALALAGVAATGNGRAARAVAIAAAFAAIGLGLIWWRAERVAAAVLAGPKIATFSARIERVEPLAARDLVRLTLAPVATRTLPRRVRVNVAEGDVPASAVRGARVRMRARLLPPPQPAVPGAYDFARVAWFAGIGATGRGFAPVVVERVGEAGGGPRAALTAHIAARLDGSIGGVAAALATGDEGAIEEADAEAMRRAGLAHLLSVSGLHITAVVAATMVVVARLLALSPWLALHARIPLIGALAGAIAAIGYTLLTSIVAFIKQR